MPNPEIAPALVERMIDIVRDVADSDYHRLRNLARGLLAQLSEPVDADLRLAREVWHADWASVGRPMDGNYSSIMAERVALAAIRRVRAEQQLARATTWQEEH